MSHFSKFWPKGYDPHVSKEGEEAKIELVRRITLTPVRIQTIDNPAVSERRACELADLHRSVFQYEKRDRGDEALRKRLRELANERRRFGYRRLGILLAREGFAVNHKKLFRLYREKSQPRSLLSIAMLNKARSRWFSANSSRTRMAQTCFGFSGLF